MDRLRTRVAAGAMDCLGRRSGRGGNDVLPPPFAGFGGCCLPFCLVDVRFVGFHPPNDSCLQSGVVEAALWSTDLIMMEMLCVQKGTEGK